MAQDIILQKNIDTYKELTDYIKQLKNEMSGLKESTQEYADKAEELAKATQKKSNIDKAAKGTLDQYNKSAKDSINALKEQIKLKNQERNAMDMGSKEYKKATAELKVLNDRLREAGTTAGDWRANVGNYTKSITSAFGQMGSAAGVMTGSLGAASSAMGGLAAASGPVGIAIAAIAGALALLTRGITSSEANSNKFTQSLAPLKAVVVLIDRAVQNLASRFLDLQEKIRGNETIMKVFNTTAQYAVTIFKVIVERIERFVEGVNELGSALKPVGDALKSTFEPVANWIGNIADKIKTALQPTIDWIIDKYNKIANSTAGKLMGLIPIDVIKSAWEEAGEAVDNFTNEVDNIASTISKLDNLEAQLAKNRRSRNEENASLQAKIAQKEAEIAEIRAKEVKTDEDYARIQDILLEKKELQGKINENNIATAKEELQLIQGRNALSDSSTEDLNAESDAKVKLTNATAAAAQTERDYQNEVRKTNKELEANQKKERATQLKTNVDTLNGALKELEATYTSTIASLCTPIAPEDNEATTGAINAYYDQIQANYDADLLAYQAMIDGKIDALEKFKAKQEELGEDTKAIDGEIAKLKANLLKKEEEINLKKEKSDRARTKAVKASYNQQLGAFSDLLGAMEGLMDENTIAYKATAIAKAIIDTFLAANQALTLPPPANWIQMAAVITTGLANVASIIKTDPTGETSAPAAPATPTPVQNFVQEQPYTYSRQVQTVEEEELLNHNYVVSVVDINNAQNKVRVRESESTW